MYYGIKKNDYNYPFKRLKPLIILKFSASYEYNGRYENPTYDMNYYDNTFMDSKSEEF